MYNEIVKEHAFRATKDFPKDSRRLVQFNFSNVEALKLMSNTKFLKEGGVVPVEIMLAKPNNILDEDPDSQWSIAMDYTRGYDIEKEASVVFRVPLDDDFFVQPFIIEFI